MQRRTKIVATIGPASRSPEVLARMVEAGMDVARLNFSHGSAEEHAETARLVRDAAGRAGRQVAILQDLPGPKLRIGKLRDGVVEFRPGDRTTFVCGAESNGEGDASRLYITYAGLASKDVIGYIKSLGVTSVELLPIVPPNYSESSVMIEVDQVLPTAVVGGSTAAYDAGRAVFLV